MTDSTFAKRTMCSLRNKGQWSPEYAIFGRLHNLAFRPGAALSARSSNRERPADSCGVDSQGEKGREAMMHKIAMPISLARLPSAIAAVIQANVKPRHRFARTGTHWTDNKFLPPWHVESYWAGDVQGWRKELCRQVAAMNHIPFWR